ncbi:hypothetical protein DB346_22945 [Verrucomicrobia bacterium LW23]|nr:hypothetical protein DB346_22945 [Verrucomicrobia bacterium LW23]
MMMNFFRRQGWTTMWIGMLTFCGGALLALLVHPGATWLGKRAGDGNADHAGRGVRLCPSPAPVHGPATAHQSVGESRSILAQALRRAGGGMAAETLREVSELWTALDRQGRMILGMPGGPRAVAFALGAEFSGAPSAPAPAARATAAPADNREYALFTAMQESRTALQTTRPHRAMQLQPDAMFEL